MLIDAEAVLFDNDGVLVDSHRQTEQAWAQLAQEYDLDITALLAELAGVRAADTLGRHLSLDRLVSAVARLEDLEVSLAPATRALAGAIDLLDQLPAKRWTIVTSATRRLAEARWRGADITIPARTVTAEDVRRGKPDPEPFLAGAQRLGIDPSRCVVFEDSPSGGAAGVAAGAVVVAVGDQPWSVEPAVRIADLTQVACMGDPDSVGGVRLSITASRART